MHNKKTTDQTEQPLDAQLRTLSEKAAHGDPQEVLKLRVFLHEHPEVWQEVGDLAKQAIKHMILSFTGKDALLRESLPLRLETFKRELAEPPGHPLEAILIDQIAICWLQANMAEIILADNSDANQGQLKFLQQRAERAQKNLGAAVKELGTVRKLLREAKARPLRQARASTKTAASQARPAAADQPPTCATGSPTDTPASNSLPQTAQGQENGPS